MKLLGAFSDFIRNDACAWCEGEFVLFSGALLVGKEVGQFFSSTEANSHSFRNLVA